MRLQLIRNATLRLTYAGHELLIDPFLAPGRSLPSFGGNSLNPTAELPFTPEAVLAGVDLTLISHLHPDHFDTVAQRMLPRSMPIMCQPGDESDITSHGFVNVMPVAAALDWQGITVHRTSGQHGTGAVGKQMGQVSGFVLQAPGEPTVYWAGDTILCQDVRAALSRFQPDIVVTHSAGASLGGTLILMDAQQTIDVCRAVPGAVVVATHMDAVDHATVRRADLRQASRTAGVSERQLLIPVDGETLDFPGDAPRQSP